MDKTHATAELGRFTFRAVTIVSILGVALAIVIAFFITNSILSSIRSLKVAAGLVAMGKFKSLPVVKSKDELGDLSIAFNEMAHRLIKLEEMYMDSSPLTRLPGGIAIENWVKKKIDRGEPFAFCMFDLDNFKPFNDRYGYSRGNSVIKNTAKIIQDCAKELGNKSDFIGHIGGDDFALITTPDKYKVICEKAIKDFDKQIVDYYNPEDKEKRCIYSKNRKGEKLTFPIMTISISVLNSEKSYVENYIEVGEIIAELKKYAKSFAKSNIVIDRRGGKKRSKKNEKKKKEE
jgi:diguanylate cyclase (GGDEF)-like protein